MNHTYFVALLVVISSLPASAQQIAPATSPIKTTNASTQKEPKEIDPEVLERRSMALLLLQSLAIDDELKDRLDRAQCTDARDRAYAFAAMRAADEGEAEKIADLDTRKGVRTFVDYNYIGTL